MDIFTSFWEKLVRLTIKIDGLVTFGAIICIIVGFVTAEKGKPFGFIMVDMGFWLGGIAMLNALYYPDEQAISRVRRCNMFMQFISSVFYLAWFALLAFFTFKLYEAIVQR